MAGERDENAAGYVTGAHGVRWAGEITERAATQGSVRRLQSDRFLGDARDVLPTESDSNLTSYEINRRTGWQTRPNGASVRG